MSTELLDAKDLVGADLTSLFSPENVVIIGASDRGPTDKAHKDLTKLGFAGKVYPVNPRREELWGAPCFKSIADVAERPGLVIISVPAVMVPAAFAASQSVTGTVKAYHSGQSLTLANGDMFTLPRTFKDPGIRNGEKVKVAYQKTGNNLQAEMVTIVK